MLRLLPNAGVILLGLYTGSKTLCCCPLLALGLMRNCGAGKACLYMAGHIGRDEYAGTKTARLGAETAMGYAPAGIVLLT
jgi:hypothetical protein